MSADHNSTGRFEWVSKRNCALTPRQMATLMAVPGLSSLAVGALFASRGAGWILFFAVIEVLALATAFFVYARYAGAYERLRVAGGQLILEFNSGSATTREELNLGLARIDVACARIPGFDGDELITVSGSGRTLSFGRFVPAAQRPALAARFRREVRLALQEGAGFSRGDPVAKVPIEPQAVS